jgi:uncharacterized protein YdhG (YjbR/CyaY superfamily)
VTALTVDSYIAARPAEVRARLTSIRTAVHRHVPDAGERISYGMPAFTLDDRPIMFVAAWKHHLSIYPIPQGDGDFRERIKSHRAAKGTLRFPLNEPLDLTLIAAIARFAAQEAAT